MAPEPAGTVDGALPELFSESQWRMLSPYFSLTPRQSEIARLICHGHTYDAIANQAGISINTVRMHIRDLFEKMDAHDRVTVVVRLVTTERALTGGRQGEASLSRHPPKHAYCGNPKPM